MNTKHFYPQVTSSNLKEKAAVCKIGGQCSVSSEWWLLWQCSQETLHNLRKESKDCVNTDTKFATFLSKWSLKVWEKYSFWNTLKKTQPQLSVISALWITRGWISASKSVSSIKNYTAAKQNKLFVSSFVKSTEDWTQILNCPGICLVKLQRTCTNALSSHSLFVST